MGRLVDQSHIHYRSQIIEVNRSEAIPDPMSGDPGDALVVGADEGYELSASPTEQALFSLTVTLTDAQIKALPATPIVIVPPTEVLNYVGTPTFVSAPVMVVTAMRSEAEYTNQTASGGAIYICLGDDDFRFIEVDPPDIVLGTGSGTYTSFLPPRSDLMNASIEIGPDAIYDNAVRIGAANDGDYTGGNAANTLGVTVIYTVIDLS